MKKILGLVFFFYTFFTAVAQTESASADVLQFKEEQFDFGKVPQGKPVYHFFELKNH